ncbi:hypothetical protein VNO77_02450 [Canavalia gladiata]
MCLAMKQLKGLPRPLPGKVEFRPDGVSMPLSRGCMRQFDSSDGFTLSVPNQACGCLRDCCFAVSAELNPRAYVFTSCTLSWNFSHIESVTHLSNDHIPLPSPCPAGFSRARAESQPHANILYHAILC